MKKTIKTLALGLAAVALMSATSARASIVVGSAPYAANSWVQDSWHDLGEPAFTQVEGIWVAGSTFENPGFISLSPGGWASSFYSPTLIAAAGPATSDIYWGNTYTGTGYDSAWILDLYAANGSCVASYELFHGNVGTGSDFDAGNGWTGNILNPALAPAPVPEPTTMIAGALLLLPFGASTLRMLRKTRKA